MNLHELQAIATLTTEVRALRADLKAMRRAFGGHVETEPRKVVPVNPDALATEMPNEEDLLMWSVAGPLPSEIRQAEQAAADAKE